MIFSLLSLSCTLIRFSMSIQAFKLPFVRLYNHYISLFSVCKDRQPFGCLVMGSSGLEPPTSRLSGARSNLLSYEPVLKSLVVFLYRLPVLASFGSLASSLSGSRYLRSLKFCRSLSGPILPVRASGLEMMGFEPMTPCLQGRCSPN